MILLEKCGVSRLKKVLTVIAACLAMYSPALGDVDAVSKLKDDTVSYFRPLLGSVVSVEDRNVTISLGEKDFVKPGMRLKIMEEGAPFIHPVTGEVLGKVEMPVGLVEIAEVMPNSSKAVLIDGKAGEGDRARISEIKIKMLFCQDMNIDWYLADEYYRKLKDSGRVEMIDTALETGDEQKVLEEAKRLGAEVALILTAGEAEKGVVLRERLFWVSDGSKFADREAVVDTDYSRELKFGEEYFTPALNEAAVNFDLRFDAKLIAAADVEGGGKERIVLSSERDIRIYEPGVDLKLIGQIKGSPSDNFVRLDALDLNRNGKSEIFVTSINDGSVVSYIYEFDGSVFKRIWEAEYFLRRLDGGVIAQAYSDVGGYTGPIFHLVWNGEYSLEGKVTVPSGVNIYDFATIKDTGGEDFLLTYDDQGFLNLYDDKGIRLWRSASDMGGFLTNFKKRSGIVFLNSGEWSVKDRIISLQNEALVVERIPVARMVSGIGYKSSRIRNYWWNGFSMEEGVVIDDIGGKVLDFTVAGDKVFILSSPFLGIKVGHILKGENPFGVMLSVYTVKDR
jgi:hypothetical protein